MGARRKPVATKTKGVLGKALIRKADSAGKVRIGIIVGKDYDPVKKGTQPPNFPLKLILTKQDWGKYSCDACTALKMQQLHPDLLHIDIMLETDVSQKRLQKNHVNITLFPEIGTVMLNGDKKLTKVFTKTFEDPDCRIFPSWDFYNWVVCKSGYMEQFQSAAVPTIPTTIYKSGFSAQQCLQDVQRHGWDKFLVKVGNFTFFGNGQIYGKTEEFLGKRMKDLEKYAKDNAKSKVFLLQPYMLKPNGEVFDEVRNFFINGQWRYSVFTHGTDESDAGYYEEPDGPRKEACKALAERAQQEIMKTAKWQGKSITPLLNRIDIGVIPKRGSDSLHKTDNQYFVNEIEHQNTTWLGRYAPLDIADVMSHATVKHSLELLVGLLNSKRRIPDEANVRKVVHTLNNRLGPFEHLKIRA